MHSSGPAAFGWFGGHGPAETAALMESLGMRPARLMAAGAGAWSVDAAIGWDVSGFWWGVGAAVLALVGAAGAVVGGRRASAQHPGGTTPVAGTG